MLSLSPQPHPRTRALAIVVIVLQLAFAAALFAVNAIAENVPGELVERVTMAEGGAPVDVQLPADPCCSASDVVFRWRLSAETARLADPAVLVSSVQDNALLRIDGQLAAGDGKSAGEPSVMSRRPLLLRIPKALAREGAEAELVVQRAVGFGYLRPFHVGDYNALHPSYQALRLLRSDLPFANAVIGAFVAAFCFCAAPLFGARSLLLSLAMLGAAWALQHVGLLMTDAPWGALASSGLYLWAFQATLAATAWFFIEWTSALALTTRDRRGVLETALFDPWPAGWRRGAGVAALGSMAVGAGLIALRLRGADPAVGLQDVNRVIGWIGLAVLPFCLARIVAFYSREGVRNVIEVSAFIFVILAAAADIVMVRFLKTYGVFLGTAVTFFPLALLVSLAVRARAVFEAATATAEQLNAIVRVREAEIVESQAALRGREREAMLVEERGRIMRDMHDGIGGQLLGMVVRARAGGLTQGEMVGGLEESLSDLRLVVDSLEQGEPSLSNALGAFRQRIEPRCEAAGALLDWRIEEVGPTPGIGPDRTLQVYRILQEACTNALRHGKPTRIAVSLRRLGPETIEIALEDDGGGFDVGSAKAGRGLANMRLRAGRIGGALTVAPTHAGTRVGLVMKG